MNLKHLNAQTLAKYPALEKFAMRLGDTPLSEVPSANGGAKVFAKFEWQNPTRTIKDRAAFAMLYRYLETCPPQEKTLLEYSGGSLGIALSAMCNELRIPLRLVLPSFFDKKKAAELEREGTLIEWVDKELGFWAVIEKAKKLAQDPRHHFLYQHENSANLWIHEVTTGQEIQDQIESLTGQNQIAAWVASIGTGATLMGVYHTLKSVSPSLKLYATTPSELPYGAQQPANGLPKFAGSGGLGDGRKQPLVAPEENLIQAHYTYSYEECLKATKKFHQFTGLWIGSSAAANWLAASKIAENLKPEEIVVTVFPSLASPFEIERLRGEDALV